jgi:Salmonella virulence plasmid 65kDa B protein
MTVPIATSMSRGNFGPQLSLAYDSDNGNGPFGFGWSLSIPAIPRETDKGLPLYDDSTDRTFFSSPQSEDLAPALVYGNNAWSPDVAAPRIV